MCLPGMFVSSSLDSDVSEISLKRCEVKREILIMQVEDDSYTAHGGAEYRLWGEW